MKKKTGAEIARRGLLAECEANEARFDLELASIAREIKRLEREVYFTCTPEGRRERAEGERALLELTGAVSALSRVVRTLG